MISASGQQFTLRLGADSEKPTRAIITELAASLRVLEISGRALIESYGAEQIRPSSAGIVMTPWPNRLDGGAWTHHGQRLQLDINQPAQQNANHGLLGQHPYRALHQDPHNLRLGATIFPRSGYPFLVETEVEYQLQPDGLTVTHRAINKSDEPAPYGVGAHPYFRLSPFDTSELTLVSPARRYYLVDERQLPIGSAPVEELRLDLTGGVKVGELSLDHGFTDLVADADGLVRTWLIAPDGSRLEIWQQAVLAHSMIYTPKEFSAERGVVASIAIEPQSCAANAFNSGDGLIWLETGVGFEASWGIRFHQAAGRERS